MKPSGTPTPRGADALESLFGKKRNKVSTAINLGAGYNAGATEIIVDDVTGFLVGDEIVIAKGTATQETVTISAITPGTNTLTISALAENQADNATVESRWDVRFHLQDRLDARPVCDVWLLQSHTLYICEQVVFGAGTFGISAAGGKKTTPVQRSPGCSHGAG